MIRVVQGDSRQVLATVASNSVDSVCTDPPYELASIRKRFGAASSAPAKVGATGAFARASAGFMGARWDTGETAFDPAFWREVYRVMKPGAYLAAFGGTRTYHRLATAIEEAGFDIRDMVAWLYGTGFPKSHDLGDGRGTALKPAHEPIVLAQKPFKGTIAANLSQWGTGVLWVDGCRIEVTDPEARAAAWNPTSPDMRGGKYGSAPGERLAKDDTSAPAGRFPANVAHDGSDEVLEAFPVTSSGAVAAGTVDSGKGAGVLGEFGGRVMEGREASTGSAARFFYSAKASRSERVSTCSVCGDHYLGARRCECLGDDGKPAPQGGHPTVKPVKLKRWLARLITPPGGLVLDPFAGTGTTGAACLEEGLSAFLIERESAYVADIMVRLTGSPER